MYDIIYITNLPAFYKINLFNRIARHKRLLVVFTHDQSVQRNTDFYKGDRKFDFNSIAKKSSIGKIKYILHLLRKTKYKHLIIGGWDQFIFLFSAFLSPKLRNGVVIESSILESTTKGFKGLIKRVFLTRVSKAYVSGKSQEDLCKSLRFKGNIIKTKGVGIFNIVPQPPYKDKSSVRNFIYVGRLSPEKNLPFLIEIFNQYPLLTLNIVGFGAQEKLLKSIANKNIKFYGEVANRDLYKIYQQNDVFILSSMSEPWGMVVEEALNNGLPVIVSDKVGCAGEIINDKNGIVFTLSNPQSLIDAIQNIQNIVYYNSLRLNISQMNFEKIAEKQVDCYL